MDEDDPVTFRVLMESEDTPLLKPCPRCGQLFDESELDAVLHHRLAQHEPLHTD